MIKKLIFAIFWILFSLLLVLIIFNYRYPFFTPSVGNWSVGFTKSTNVFPSIDLDTANIISFKYIDSITPEKYHFIADPFFIKEKDIYYLFVELKGKSNADIALLTSPDGKNFKFKGIVLDEDFHLSYPQVFEHKGEFYMLPETSGANQALLYKAKRFPYEWIIIDTLIKNRSLKDPSLLLSDDLNLIVAVDDNLKQIIFEADSLHGSWMEATSYKQRWGNETRPGGRFFEVDNNWYLPLQNSSRGYGTGISLYKLIFEKNQLQFRLAENMYLGPQKKIEWFNRGMHHLDIQKNGDEYFIVYDGDRNLINKMEFQYKRTIKFNLIDIYNFFK
tara:strand:+ start:6306 stop:7301 length:996 start_codon:yes stop_codon:yes gene_type:complete